MASDDSIRQCQVAVRIDRHEVSPRVLVHLNKEYPSSVQHFATLQGALCF
jgi:hypothetical protein